MEVVHYLKYFNPIFLLQNLKFFYTQSQQALERFHFCKLLSQYKCSTVFYSMRNYQNKQKYIVDLMSIMKNTRKYKCLQVYRGHLCKNRVFSTNQIMSNIRKIIVNAQKLCIFITLKVYIYTSNVYQFSDNIFMYRSDVPTEIMSTRI